MDAAKVPGLALVVLRRGGADTFVSGLRNQETRAPVTSETVFQAASLSKPLVAHAALQLAEEGILDLDEPLAPLAGRLVPGDELSAAITARHVLAHETGLPNWRSSTVPLRSHFPPGARFSYSGEGFVYLQRALERLAGEPLDVLVKRLVLDPLGMHGSSFVWRADFPATIADAHAETGKVLPRFIPRTANAACSLLTTAVDYGRFLAACLDGSLLGREMTGLWMTPRHHPPARRIEALAQDDSECATGVAWGLGWGLEPEAGTFFHWGSNIGAKAFALGNPARREAFVLFANGERGLDIVPDIVDIVMPGDHPALAWLGLARQS
ncbi:MAG: serine hydrolase domain-containing protein [Parvibaculaceae bacterium]